MVWGLVAQVEAEGGEGPRLWLSAAPAHVHARLHDTTHGRHGPPASTLPRSSSGSWHAPGAVRPGLQEGMLGAVLADMEQYLASTEAGGGQGPRRKVIGRSLL